MSLSLLASSFGISPDTYCSSQNHLANLNHFTKMKKLFFLAITAMMLMACGNKTATNNESEADNDAVEETLQEAEENTAEETTTKEVSGRDGYKFQTSFRKNDDGQCDALILNCKSGDKSQEFICEFNWPKSEEFLGDAGDLSEVDINFDGTPDVLVSLGDFGIDPSSSLNFYAAFVWNDDKQCFEQVNEISDIANIDIIEEFESIESNYQGVDGSIYWEQYKWKDGKLVMTESRCVEQNVEDE